MAGIFGTKGVWSMGFDMSPTASAVFTGGGSASPNLGSANSANTAYGFGFAWNLNNQFSVINLNANLATLWLGFWVKLAALPGTNQRMIAFYDHAGTIQCNLRVYSDGHFAFCQGSGTTLIVGTSASATGLISANTYCHIQVKITINNTTGEVGLVVNDTGSHTTAISATGLNTRSSTNNEVSQVEFNSVINGNCYYDDVWMLDNSAASPLNTYLGIKQCKGEKASANSGTSGHNQWAPTNPQNDNHLNVGNAPFNSAQYNAAMTPGQYDMFPFPSLAAVSVSFVTAWVECGLENAGAPHTVKIECDSGGTIAESASITPGVVATPTFTNECFIVDPATSSAWTVSAAQAAELGLKINT